MTTITPDQARHLPKVLLLATPTRGWWASMGALLPTQAAAPSLAPRGRGRRAWLGGAGLAVGSVADEARAA